MLFFFDKPKESTFVKILRLIITVLIQTSSLHLMHYFLLSKARQVHVFHKMSMSYSILYTIEAFYHKIHKGCMVCFFSNDLRRENDPIDEKFLVLAMSYHMFMIPYHYARRFYGLKGLFNIIQDILAVLELSKSVLEDRGGNAIVLMMFVANASDPFFSLICILKSSNSCDCAGRGKRYALLEATYLLVFMVFNIGGFLLFLGFAVAGKYNPPPLLTTAFLLKIISTSVVFHFLSMLLRRRYLAAISSFFKQIFARTVMSEIDYLESD